MFLLLLFCLWPKPRKACIPSKPLEEEHHLLKDPGLMVVVSAETCNQFEFQTQSPASLASSPLKPKIHVSFKDMIAAGTELISTFRVSTMKQEFLQRKGI